MAGQRAGLEGKRSTLWGEFARIIRELRPRWVLAENVCGLLSANSGRFFGTVLRDLAAAGYDAEWQSIPAAAVGAPHLRWRVFIVAYPQGIRGPLWQTEERGQKVRRLAGNRHEVPHADIFTPIGTTKSWQEHNHWATEPAVGRLADGVPAELDFIGGLVNAQGNYSQTEPEARRLVWVFLRAMWEHRQLATASPRLYVAKLLDLMPDVPQERAFGRWLLGKRIEANQELRDLWEAFYAKSYEEAQDMQSNLLERIRQTKRPQEMGSRIDRLRCLGNAVVPQVAEYVGRMIVDADSRRIV